MARIKIEKGLYSRARDLAAKAGYSSVDELVVHLLEKELSAEHITDDANELKQQLRGLGYIE